MYKDVHESKSLEKAIAIFYEYTLNYKLPLIFEFRLSMQLRCHLIRGKLLLIVI